MLVLYKTIHMHKFIIETDNKGVNKLKELLKNKSFVKSIKEYPETPKHLFPGDKLSEEELTGLINEAEQSVYLSSEEARKNSRDIIDKWNKKQE